VSSVVLPSIIPIRKHVHFQHLAIMVLCSTVWYTNCLIFIIGSGCNVEAVKWMFRKTNILLITLKKFYEARQSIDVVFSLVSGVAVNCFFSICW
jgi:hypothetical protein